MLSLAPFRIVARPVRPVLLPACIALALLLPACSTYQAPGGPAEWSALGVRLEQSEEWANATPTKRAKREQEIREDQTDVAIARSFDLQPLASFPVAIATVRVQSPMYDRHSPTSSRFTVIDDRAVEGIEHVTKLESLPHVHGVAPLNRLVLPPSLLSHDQLRQGAAAVRAEMLLIYTLDTRFYEEDRSDPVETVTLGLWSSDRTHWVCNASAVLMDTRNGYIYGLASGRAKDSRPMSAWRNRKVIDEARRSVEQQAFDELVDRFCSNWRRIIAAFGPRPESATGPEVTSTSSIAADP